MQKYLILLLLFMLSSTLFAQNVTITGEVFNPITGEGIEEANVKIINVSNDSVLAMTKSHLNMVVEERNGSSTTRFDTKSGAAFSVNIPSSYQGIVVVISAAGYESEKKTIQISLGRNLYDLGIIHLLPEVKGTQLKEATVTATKIKMYYKGDTLVYNADAFNVLKNESLRKLVMQLPNTKIEEDVIYVNGKPIESLLFSGKDFFNGNVDAALDRLPAYIVSKVKVYDKKGEMSELTGRDMHDKQYVMDVHLKREYIGSWMAKLEADAATEKLWGGQGFLMRMDDRQMFSINTDVNNFNEERKMMDICTMIDPIMQGRHKNKEVNMEYFFEPNHTWRFSSNLSIQQQEQRTASWTNTETFLTPTDMMNKSKTMLSNKATRVNAYASLRVRQTKKWQSELTYDFTFNNVHDTQDALSLAFWMKSNEDWHAWEVDSIYASTLGNDAKDILYTLLSPTLQKQKTFTYKPEWKTSFVLNGNPLNVSFLLNHNNVQNDVFNHYKLDYYTTKEQDHRRILKDQDERHTAVEATADYVHKWTKNETYDALLTPYIVFKHVYGNLSHPYYRLERMQQWSESMGWTKDALGILPDGEWRSLCLDIANSYYSKNKRQMAQIGLRTSQKMVKKERGTLQLDADISGVFQYGNLNYLRDEQSYKVGRHAYSFQPIFTLQYKSSSKRKWLPELWFNYKGEYQLPDLLNVLPFADNADPLNVFRGNTMLDGKYTHHVSWRYNMGQRKTDHNLYVSMQYLRIHNDMVCSSLFNAENGGRIYEMVNTNRTHSVSGDMGYSLPLDKKRNFYITLSLRGHYRQNADLSHFTSKETDHDLLKQYGITPNAKMRGTIGQTFRFSCSWHTAFSNIKQSAANTSYRETKVSADFSWELPWHLQLASDFNMRMYDGYADASINKAHYKWNATLAKTFFEDKLSVRLIANGIVTPRNQIYSTVNATSRVETYTDILPRYFMLSLVYSWDWTQKSRK